MSHPDLVADDPRYWERIERARQMSPEERVREVGRLSAAVLRIMCDGVRSEFPDASEDEVIELVRQRIDKLKELDRRG